MRRKGGIGGEGLEGKLRECLMLNPHPLMRLRPVLTAKKSSTKTDKRNKANDYDDDFDDSLDHAEGGGSGAPSSSSRRPHRPHLHHETATFVGMIEIPLLQV